MNATTLDLHDATALRTVTPVSAPQNRMVIEPAKTVVERPEAGNGERENVIGDGIHHGETDMAELQVLERPDLGF